MRLLIKKKCTVTMISEAIMRFSVAESEKRRYEMRKAKKAVCISDSVGIRERRNIVSPHHFQVPGPQRKSKAKLLGFLFIAIRCH